MVPPDCEGVTRERGGSRGESSESGSRAAGRQPRDIARFLPEILHVARWLPDLLHDDASARLPSPAVACRRPPLLAACRRASKDFHPGLQLNIAHARFFFSASRQIWFKSEKNADRRASQTQTNVGVRTVLFVPKHMIGFVTPIWLECVLDLAAAAGAILLLIAAHEVLLLKNCCAPCLTRGQTPVGF